jgi:ADP-ribosyl-[dinitrogen reductase] hydrolase
VDRERMRDRAQGCLLGQLIGDSLGSLVEFKRVDQIHALYPHGCRELRNGGTWDNLAGQPTDDSELALMLARTLAKVGRYDRGAVLDAYIHWFKHAWDIGGTIRAALGPAARGATTAERLRIVEQCTDPNKPTNGSLMRISPLGIFGAGQPVQAADWAREDSRLTHPHPLCQDACAVYIAALATAIGSDAGPRACFEAARAEAERSNAPDDIHRTLDAARLVPPADYVTNMGWVLIALQNAFYQLLHAPSVEEGIVDTIVHGGDTDTTAAIAGALLGAVHGRRQFPQRWLDTLLSCRPERGSGTAHPQPPEFWPVDALELAEALLDAGQHAV